MLIMIIIIRILLCSSYSCWIVAH